jgi:glycosyltransferase involved in cell wall biosynthesis
MKICMLSNALSVHTQRWAAAFAARGHEVHLLSIRKTDIKGVHVHTVNVGPINSTSTILTLLSYFYLLITARYRIKKIKPDIVNAHYAMTHGVIAAFANIHPLAITVWGADVIYDKGAEIPGIKSLFLKYAFNRADMITGTSRFLIKQIRNFVFPQKEIEQVAFGVDVSKFSPLLEEGESDIVKIGFAKSLRKKYAPDILVKAFKKINQEYPDTKLIIAGDGAMESGLKKMATDLELSDKIEFMGFLSEDKLVRHFKSLDIFIQSSIYQSESFGVAVLEASACGVPVVATNVGGVPEVCIDGQTGFLVPPNDPDAIAATVSKLLKDKQLMRTLGENGRTFVVNNYTWSNCVDKMLKLFQGLVQKAK